MLTIDEYFQRLAHLMDLEAEAEKQALLKELESHTPAEAEASGSSLINLVVRDEESGMGGRILLTLAKRNQTLSLPWNRLGVGSPVVLSEQGGNGRSEGWRGVVCKTGRESIQVALQQWPEPETDNPTFRLDRSNDEISRQRMRRALDRTRAATNNRLADLRDVLLGKLPFSFQAEAKFQPFNLHLNPSQLDAVQFSLSAEDVAIIHGPPGTGKTTAVVELIRQLISRGERVLVCAPSNLAVDNLLERLLAAGEKAIRLGHPARVLPELRAHTLDLLVENHPDVRLANKLAREAYALRRQASKFTRARPEPGEKKGLRQEAKQMLAEARQIEEQVIEHILDSAPILCATMTGLDRDLLGERRFDWCIIDEASQSIEPAVWIPLQFADRLVLAGDHFQLPPTVISTEAASQGFNISLLERLLAGQYASLARRLTVQYRMHHDIMHFSSQEFYENSLVANVIVENHKLMELPGVAANELTETPIHFIDTAGANYDESPDSAGESRLNISEADFVLVKVRALLDSGLPAKDIAIITPYAAQVKYLREHFKDQPEVEIDSVDGFQGREKEAVVVSLVRSNRDGEIGFLADVRRMNVALTRARRKLIVIGDSATVAAHPFYQRMIDYFETIGAYHSIWEDEHFISMNY